MAQLKDTTITGDLAVTGSTNITGTTQATGNVTLYASSGDSPSLIFQRGTLGDTLNDYQIYDTGGHIVIKQQGNSGTSGFTEVARLNNSGTFTVSTPPATNTTPSTQAWISPTDSAIKIVTDATIASGDKLVIRDASDANRMRSTSITFGSSTTQFLANDGTWQTISAGSSVNYEQITIATSGWSSNSATVTVTGMTSTAVVWVNPSEGSKTYWTRANIRATAQSTDSLTFTCTDQSLASYQAIVVDVAWAEVTQS